MMEEPKQGEVSPDKQDLYDIFVSQGILIVTSMKQKPTKDLEQLSTIMAGIVTRIETSGAENGYKFPLEVLLHGSREILSSLLQVSKIELTEEEIKNLVGMMIGKYFDMAIKSGRMTKEEVIALSEQAKQSGTAQQMKPGNQQMPPTESAQPQGLLGGKPNG